MQDSMKQNQHTNLQCTNLFKIYFNIILSSMSVLPSSLIPWHSSSNILHALIVSPIPFLLIPHDLTILITLGERYRLPSSILCQFFQYFASSPLLNPAKQGTADKENFCPALLVECPMNWRFKLWTDDNFDYISKSRLAYLSCQQANRLSRMWMRLHW